MIAKALFSRIAEWWNRPPAPACYDCGTSIIAADDDALICVQCGGRNRRVGHRVGSNPPAPSVGGMLAPPPGPSLLNERVYKSGSHIPWIDPEKERMADNLSVAAGFKAKPWPPRIERWTDQDGVKWVGVPADVEPGAIIELEPDERIKWPEAEKPLTADEVRKIVREEIERALRPVGKSGKMGPG